MIVLIFNLPCQIDSIDSFFIHSEFFFLSNFKILIILLVLVRVCSNVCESKYVSKTIACEPKNARMRLCVKK